MKSKAPTSPTPTESTSSTQRKVSLLLGIGIFLLPIIFSWFTLRKGHTTLARCIAFGWLAFCAYSAFTSHNSNAPSTVIPKTATEQTTSTPKTTATTAAPAAPASKWVYKQDEDKMRGAIDKFAYLHSQNEVEFDFPYSGGSSGIITLRDSKKFGKDAIFSVTKGQMPCFMECKINVKFDDGAITSFSAASSADGSSETLFISNYQRFLTKLKAAKKVIIEASFYKEGMQQFEFDVSGLNWQ